ncbi:MAG: hypothetical protein WAX69_15810, partial [Victivallales bacterium]
MFSVNFSENGALEELGTSGDAAPADNLSGSSTIQVRKVEDFPQVLLQGQRVALFLDDGLLPELGSHLVLESLLTSKAES